LTTTTGSTESSRGAQPSALALVNCVAVWAPRQDAGLCLPHGVVKRSWRPPAVTRQLLSTVRHSAFVAELKRPAGANRRCAAGFRARNAAHRSAPTTTTVPLPAYGSVRAPARARSSSGRRGTAVRANRAASAAAGVAVSAAVAGGGGAAATAAAVAAAAAAAGDAAAASMAGTAAGAWW